MTDHKKDFEECETTTKFEQSEPYGNIYRLVSMGYYLWANLMIYGPTCCSLCLFASLMICELLNVYLHDEHEGEFPFWVLLCTAITVIVVVVVTGSVLLCTAATMIGWWVYGWWVYDWR